MERKHRFQSQSSQVAPLEVGRLGTNPVPARASHLETLALDSCFELAPLEFLGIQQVPELGTVYLYDHEVNPMACPKTDSQTRFF